MAENKKQTSPRVARIASRILRSSQYSKAAKSVAWSALAQAKSRTRK